MTPPARLLTGLVLTAVAGFVDALAFIELGGYFASFMSGNTTQLGLAMSGPDGRAVQLLRGQSLFMPLLLIGLFFSGAFIASFISAREQRWYSIRVLLMVIALLAGIVLFGQLLQETRMPVMLLAAAMGAQNAVFKADGAARLGTTFVTGTIFNAASDLANGLRGQVPRRRWLQHVSVWVSLVIGAASGAVLYNYFGLNSLLLPVVVLSVMLGLFISKKA
ncbi:YoaK family protein [Pseudochrobactrum sp. sp1633]|uniref:YoaK family protein n=1 Tax=Pseudochrobactrum sp. sp1633 TaxID=3036706 RepID=UPI0025A5A420|nr:YoaK family protein [Pseudochrobactrum sp. sp1633]MDM8345809.1 YoaK family protein [Pseudochrobactrum sp. sp1633]HWD12513.1 YoaK family protein [Pseudochrobactrum sp.]